ncbi:hypothetical protein AACH10_08825 [Ideonella sp. DXS22W]|uniref:TonB C-terminal domain-containing protein n=1 Tax=Pseudaquabacterium inlustre TaxID=2984192 RepID=A0ABU9CIE7_9BURK
MHCTERPATAQATMAAGWCTPLAGAALLMLLSGCSQPPAVTAPAVPAEAPPAAARSGAAPVPPAAPGPATAPPKAAAPRRAAPARGWDEWRRQAAQQLVAANAGRTYDGVPPEPLLAIPVLEVELNADGSVRRVGVLRRPGQAHDTVQLAIDAVHRAAPFAPVSHLPRPWKYTETFLFADDRRFKPRTLD